MNEEQQLKLQAFLDGELSETEARIVAAWLEGDADAEALTGELRNTRQALAAFDCSLTLPESREFYWSKIEREIQAPEPSTLVDARSFSWRQAVRRFLAPVLTVTVLLVGVTLGLELGLWRSSARTPQTEMTVADARAFTYQDFANGTTLVWVSYPAESGFAKKTAH